MKYRVMLVEDEQIIREGIEAFVNWDSLGFEIVASLSDGREALQYLENNTVDLIISDIEMTFVSGIALAKYIFEKKGILEGTLGTIDMFIENYRILIGILCIIIAFLHFLFPRVLFL